MLEETLHGSIKALTDVLALANPTAFGRSVRAKKLIAGLIARQNLEESWHIEVATMLSQVSTIALPPEIAEKVYRGDELTPDEQRTLDKLPYITESLLGNIPRIESVRKILRFQNTRYDGTGSPERNVAGEAIPIGARMLKIVLDYDTLVSKLGREDLALESLRRREGWYDPALLNSFAKVCAEMGQQGEIRAVKPQAVQVGMIFSEDLRTQSGQLLVARGQEVNDSLQARVQHWSLIGAISGDLMMIVPPERKSNEEQHALRAYMTA